MIILADLYRAGVHSSEFSDPDTPRYAAVATADQLAPATAMGQSFEIPGGIKFNRAPRDMPSWEIYLSYRLAWHLACLLPSANLAQALANWLCAAQRDLERRGEWLPEALPPESMLPLPEAGSSSCSRSRLASMGAGRSQRPRQDRRSLSAAERRVPRPCRGTFFMPPIPARQYRMMAIARLNNAKLTPRCM